MKSASVQISLSWSKGNSDRVAFFEKSLDMFGRFLRVESDRRERPIIFTTREFSWTLLSLSLTIKPGISSFQKFLSAFQV